MEKKDIQEIRLKIENVRKRESVNEAQTKEWLIRPFFEKLGWDFTNPETVTPEETDPAGERPDYTLIINGQKKLLIEAKKLGFKINEKDLTKKLNYCTSANVDFLVVSDGQVYQLYYSKIVGEANAKLLKEIDLLEDHDDDFDLLSFESIKKNNLVKYASNIFLFGNIKKALNKLFDNPTKNLLE